MTHSLSRKLTDWKEDEPVGVCVAHRKVVVCEWVSPSSCHEWNIGHAGAGILCPLRVEHVQYNTTFNNPFARAQLRADTRLFLIHQRQRKRYNKYATRLVRVAILSPPFLDYCALSSLALLSLPPFF